MHRKSDPTALASLVKKEVKNTPFSSWNVYRQFSNQLLLLYKEEHGRLTYKVQYILTFPFKIPSWLPAHEKYLLVYSSPDCLEKTSQKIRYFRHKNCMYAKDVAKYLGMDRTNYGHYEEVAYEYCPLAILEKLATLYHIPVTDLMDDYHLFLYNGQGNRVLQYRKNLHLTQQEMADKLGVNRTTVRLWEKEFHRMTRPTYEALFIQKILE